MAKGAPHDIAGLIAGYAEIPHFKVDATMRMRADSVAFSPDGNLLASATFGGGTKIWNPQTHELIQDLAFGGPFSKVIFSPDGRLLAELAGNMLWLRAVPGYAVLRNIFMPAGPTTTYDMVFSHDGALLATASDDGVRIWESNTGVLRNFLPAPDVTSISFSPNGMLLVAACPTHGLRLWDTATYTPTEITRIPRPRHIAFSPDGSLLAVAGDTITFLDVASRTDRGVVATYANSILFGPDGSYLVALSAVSDEQLEMTLIDVHNAAIIDSNYYTEEPLAGAGPFRCSMALNPAGTILITGSAEALKFWRKTEPVKETLMSKRKKSLKQDLLKAIYRTPTDTKAAAAFAKKDPTLYRTVLTHEINRLLRTQKATAADVKKLGQLKAFDGKLYAQVEAEYKEEIALRAEHEKIASEIRKLLGAANLSSADKKRLDDLHKRYEAIYEAVFRSLPPEVLERLEHEVLLEDEHEVLPE